MDHPGLPLQELLALTFRSEALARQVVQGEDADDHVRALLVDLDRTRWAFRGYAIAFYILGGVLTALLLGRMFGHWYWACIGGVLWIGATNLPHMSIQYRPDVPLAALVLLVGFLIARAYDTRSISNYALAAFALGFAVTVKVHAAALLPSLVIAAAAHPPVRGWTDDAVDKLRRRALASRRYLISFAIVWLLASALLAPDLTPATVVLGFAMPLLAATIVALALLAMTRRPQSTLGSYLALASVLGASLLLGLLLPVSLMPRSGFEAVRYMADNLRGQGVNEEVDAFDQLDRLLSVHMRPTVLLISLALVAAAVGLRKHTLWPSLWAVASIVAALFAAARQSMPHYYAPSYMLAIPAVFWLAMAGRRYLLPVAAVPLAAWVGLVQLKYREGSSNTAKEYASVGTEAARRARTHLQPGEVSLTPLNFPIADARYFNEVHDYIVDPPPKRYTFLPISASGYRYAVSNGLRVRYYVTAEPGVTNWLGPNTSEVAARDVVVLESAGTFRVVRRVDTTTFEIVRVDD